MSKNFLNYILVLDGALLFVSFQCVSRYRCFIFFGCVGVRLFCCFVGVAVVTSDLRPELLDGDVWYDFPFISIVVI